jgi:hypothetical protein
VEITCRVYRPRDPRKTPLYGLLDSLYERVKGAWEERFERSYGFCQSPSSAILFGMSSDADSPWLASSSSWSPHLERGSAVARGSAVPAWDGGRLLDPGREPLLVELVRLALIQGAHVLVLADRRNRVAVLSAANSGVNSKARQSRLSLPRPTKLPVALPSWRSLTAMVTEVCRLGLQLPATADKTSEWTLDVVDADGKRLPNVRFVYPQVVPSPVWRAQ